MYSISMRLIQPLIDIALNEDIGLGDITTDNLINSDLQGKAVIVAKQTLMVAGLDIVRHVFLTLDPEVKVSFQLNDGDIVNNEEILMKIEGKLATLLVGERTALNFLQRLSGIATNVRSYVDELAGSKVRLVDTRKTVPGWRILEKYAVRVGGAFNHRMSLFDGVLIKDNHIAVSGGIKAAVKKLRKKVHHLIKIEIEVTSFQELKEALDVGVDVIMLDNMSLEQVREAVKIVNGRAIVETSGMIVKKDLKLLANTKVDIISSGALTHQARSVDISMRIM